MRLVLGILDGLLALGLWPVAADVPQIGAGGKAGVKIFLPVLPASAWPVFLQNAYHRVLNFAAKN